MLKPRRLLSNGKTGGKNDENLVSPSADVSTNELISIMSDNMKTMFENLNRKVDSMASDIENRLSKKFSQIIDKRISSEVSKMTKDINARIDIVKNDIYKEFDDLEAQVKDLSYEKADLGPSGDIDLRIVLRKGPETRNENVTDTVNGIIRDGLTLRDIEVVKAERKLSDRQQGHDSRPPVIVASFKSTEDKHTVMSNKKKLNDDRNKHKRVFLHNDQTKAERIQRANFQTILDFLQKNESRNLQMRGLHVIRGSQNSNDYMDIDSRGNERRDGLGNERRQRERETLEDRERNRDIDRSTRQHGSRVPRPNAERPSRDTYRNRSQPTGRSRR